MVQAFLNKENGDIKFHIMGNDHFDSTEEDFEAETLATRDLMETGFGRSVIPVKIINCNCKNHKIEYKKRL